MNYSELVAVIGERNRPSGGLRSVNTFCREARVSASTRVLEVGSNTGFTSVNIALLTGASVVGIDISPKSVALAKKYAQDMRVVDLVDFICMDACSIELADSSFDAVWASNVPSFTTSKKALLGECGRVLKDCGFLGVAPIYYQNTAPDPIVDEVSRLVGARVGTMKLEDWLKLIRETGSENAYRFENTFIEIGEFLDQNQRIAEWCAERLGNADWSDIEPDRRRELSSRYINSIQLFNENLSYCRYAITIFQKRTKGDEPELFLTRTV